jgi:hypothetical protein
VHPAEQYTDMQSWLVVVSVVVVLDVVVVSVVVVLDVVVVSVVVVCVVVVLDVVVMLVVLDVVVMLVVLDATGKHPNATSSPSIQGTLGISTALQSQPISQP